MGWDEIKKALNTDINEPLNYHEYIDDLIMFGNESYILDSVNKQLWEELCVNSILLYKHPRLKDLVAKNLTQENADATVAKSSKLGFQLNNWHNTTAFPVGGINKILATVTLNQVQVLSPVFFKAFSNYCESKVSNTTDLGKWIVDVFGSAFTEFKSFANIKQIVDNQERWDDILKSESLFLTISASETGVRAILDSTSGFERLKQVLLNPNTLKGTCIEAIGSHSDLVSHLLNSEELINKIASEESSTIAFLSNKAFVGALENPTTLRVLGRNPAAVRMLYKLYSNLNNSKARIVELEQYAQGLKSNATGFSTKIKLTNEYQHNSIVTAEKLKATEDSFSESLRWAELMIKTYKAVDSATESIVFNQTFNESLCDTPASMDVIINNDEFWACHKTSPENTVFMNAVNTHSAGIGKYLAKLINKGKNYNDFDEACKDASFIEYIIGTGKGAQVLLGSTRAMYDIGHNPIALNEFYKTYVELLVTIKQTPEMYKIFCEESDNVQTIGGCVDIANDISPKITPVGQTFDQQIKNIENVKKIVKSRYMMTILSVRPKCLRMLMDAAGAMNVLTKANESLEALSRENIGTIQLIGKLVGISTESTTPEYMKSVADSSESMRGIVNNLDALKAVVANSTFWGQICASEVAPPIIFDSDNGKIALDANPQAVVKLFSSVDALTGIIRTGNKERFDRMSSSVSITRAIATNSEAVKLMFADEILIKSMLASNTAMTEFGKSAQAVAAICTFLEKIEVSQKTIAQINAEHPSLLTLVDKTTGLYSEIGDKISQVREKLFSLYNGVHESTKFTNLTNVIGATLGKFEEFKNVTLKSDKALIEDVLQYVDKMVETANMADEFAKKVFTNDTFLTQLIANKDAILVASRSRAPMKIIANNSSICKNVLRNPVARDAIIKSNIAIGEFTSSAIAMKEIFTSSTDFFTVIMNNEEWYTALANSKVAMAEASTSVMIMNKIADSGAVMYEISASTTAMNAVVNSTTAMNAVVNSITAMGVIANSVTAMRVITGSVTAMGTVTGSIIAINAIVKSAAAINVIAKSSWGNIKPFIKAMNHPRNLDKLVAMLNTVATSLLFQMRFNLYSDNVSSLNQYCTDNNILVFCSLGASSSSNSSSTSLVIDNERIATGTIYQPSMVGTANINALGIFRSMFTPTNNAQAAIMVFKAI